jgi:hypothetical protein|tara:strand:- start:147 stop:503 length:357 start_codon:yes stop_codon:yes gene_type:complete
VKASEFCDLLGGQEVPASGDSLGSYEALCPAHDDKTPSLCITQIEGKTLLYCRSGCKAIEILDEMDLDWSALFDEEYPVVQDEWSKINRKIQNKIGKERKALRFYAESGYLNERTEEL